MRNWRNRKRLTILIHKHELYKHSDYKEWVKEWCIVSGYYGKSRYQLLKEWKDVSDGDVVEKIDIALSIYARNKEMSRMMKDLIDGGWYDAIQKAVDKVREVGALRRADDDMDVSVIDTFFRNDKGVQEKKEKLVIFGYEN